MPKRPPALARAPGGAAGPPPSAPCVRPERPVGSRIRDPVDFYGKKGSPWHRSSLAASLQPDNRSAFNPSSSGWGSSYDASGGPTSPDPKIPTPGTAGCLAAEITGKKKKVCLAFSHHLNQPGELTATPKLSSFKDPPSLQKNIKKSRGGETLQLETFPVQIHHVPGGGTVPDSPPAGCQVSAVRKRLRG